MGLTIHQREISNFGAWTDIATLPASTYPAGNLDEGDTDTDVQGDDYTMVADGGWRDVTVSIPNTYDEIRLRPELNAGGTESGQDIALRSIRSAGGPTPPPPPPPTPGTTFDWRFDTLAAFRDLFHHPARQRLRPLGSGHRRGKHWYRQHRPRHQQRG